MIHLSGKITCDAEISKPGRWRGCRRPAVVAIQASTCELHYCLVHQGHAYGRDGLYFHRQAGALPRQLTA